MSRYVGGLLWLLASSAASAAETPTSLSGPQGYAPHVARDLVPGALLDASGARFRVANSANAHPTEDRPCETGSQPINPYPLQVRDSFSPEIVGGLFAGEVPLFGDWIDVYCNSAAIGVWNSPGVVIRDSRIRRAWDAIRIGPDTPGFLVDEVWLSEVRDDCIENDFRSSGALTDSLLDGCFVGVSLRPVEDAAPADDTSTMALTGVLMRLQPYLYRGETRQGQPLKTGPTAPMVTIRDSVIVMEGPDILGPSAMNAAWNTVAGCTDNLLLWTSPEPWPDALDAPPDCFEVLHGTAAEARWNEVKQNWIDCHPEAARFPEDPAARPERCDPAAYGGQY